MKLLRHVFRSNYTLKVSWELTMQFSEHQKSQYLIERLKRLFKQELGLYSRNKLSELAGVLYYETMT